MKRPITILAVLAVVAAPGVWLKVRAEPLSPVEPARRPELAHVERLVVTLADPGGDRYLRASLAVELEPNADAKDEAPPATGEAEPKPSAPDRADPGQELFAMQLRDRAFAVLGARRARDLAGAEQKEALRLELEREFAALAGDARVRNVLFTDLLVQ
jgi:flagellar basal body-associated protein FliL